MKAFDKDDLYKSTKWFSKDCEELIEKLKRAGLAIVSNNEIEKVNWLLFCLEDDGK